MAQAPQVVASGLHRIHAPLSEGALKERENSIGRPSMPPLKRIFLCGAAVVIAVCACAGPRQVRPGPPRPDGQMTVAGEQEQNIKLMLSFDGNSDGIVTRAEMEAALKRQFEACDTNHDGRIDLSEMQAENDRRFRAFGTAASPLIDWNQDGQIDFDEFAATARSVFAELDRNHDGRLDGNELRLTPAGRGSPTPPQGQGGGRGRGQNTPRGGLASPILGK
jgi:Ca2+-binding EF-hand superfamily protein